MPSKRDRRSISVMLKGIFSRNNSKRTDSESSLSWGGGNKKSKNESVDFGIQDTEKLVHFTRPKPPRNRRPPRAGSGQKIASSMQSSMQSLATDDNRSVASSSFVPKSRESLRSAGSSNGLLIKSASNLSEDAADGKKEPEEKKKSSIWNLFHREKSNKSVEVQDEEEEEEDENDQPGGSGDDERLISKDQRGEEEQEEEEEEEEEVEKRVKEHLRAGKRVLRSESFGAEELNLTGAGRRGSPYTSYQEFIRVTHKSMPNTEVVIS